MFRNLTSSVQNIKINEAQNKKVRINFNNTEKATIGPRLVAHIYIIRLKNIA